MVKILGTFNPNPEPKPRINPTPKVGESPGDPRWNWSEIFANPTMFGEWELAQNPHDSLWYGYAPRRYQLVIGTTKEQLQRGIRILLGFI